jgi:positive regulator of sigma E activity
MAKDIGKVTNIKDEWIDIKIPTGSGCTACHSKASCSFLGPDSAYRHVKIPYQSGIEIGDRVTLGTAESAQNISAFIIFGLPILLILAGYFIATQFPNIPNAEIWGVIGGFVIYGAVLIITNRWFSKLPLFLPKIIDVERTKNQATNPELKI